MAKPSLVSIEPKHLIKLTKNGEIFLGNEKITPSELKSLQEEIKFLEKTRIWTVLTTTLAETARQIMFEKSQSFDDMRTGKAMLYNIDMMKRLMSIIKTSKLG